MLGGKKIGEMAEWLKATDCKSVRVMRTKVRILLSPPFKYAGVAQW